MTGKRQASGAKEKKTAANKSKSLKSLPARGSASVTGGKRTTVRDAHDKYANQ